VSRPQVGTAPGLGEDTGPHPAVRAATGLLLGFGVGLVSALLLPRRHDQHRSGEMSEPPSTSSAT
jgi:hypothetical protein